MSESNVPPSSPSTPLSSSPSAAKSMDEIMSLCKRRGFIYQASEIYGGINGFWDYGPLGAQLKKNLREAWWEDMIMMPCWGRAGPGGERVRCVPVETCIIQNPKVWEASGHVGGFNDPMVDCRECKSRFRADHLFVCLWADFDAMKAQLPKKDDADELTRRYSEELSNAFGEVADDLRGGDLHSAERRMSRLNEISSRWAYDLRKALAPMAKIVEATNRDEAIEQSKLTGRERKLFKDPFIAACVPFSEAMGGLIPSVAPASCPRCNSSNSLTEPRQFNLMFRTYIGATATEDDIAYLRPETAQGIFVQFKNVVDTTRVKVPFGIGNVGKSFRNEVTPRNFTFRSREFEQMELEFFCHPDESAEWYKFWRDFRMEWWQSIGLKGENLILREHEKDELSHYSSGTSDVEYRFPFTAPGFGELEGIAHRGNYDLTQHQKHSGAKLEYFDQERGELLPNGSHKGERYLPHCIEPAAGLDRGVLAVLCEGYTKDPSRPSPEIMRFHPRLAPIKAGVYPLVNKDGMPEVAEKLHAELQKKFGKLGFVEYDAKQAIGKRYARMDEAGCPFCFTIDGETLTNQTVTVRDRDTGAQERIGIDKVSGYLAEKLGV